MFVYWILVLVSTAALSSEAAWAGNRAEGPLSPNRGARDYKGPRHQFRPPHYHSCHLENSKLKQDHWNDKDSSEEWNWGYEQHTDPPHRPKPKPGPTPPAPPPRQTKSTAVTTTIRASTISTMKTKQPSRATDFDTCMFSCPITPEYNPVCGSDGVTYPNPSRLECARYCGLDVTMSRASRCPTGSGGPTTALPVSPSMEIIRMCIIGCPVTSEYNPVCGTDGVTYTNPSRLECAKMCGANVELSRNSRCPAGGVTSQPLTNSPPTQKPTVSPPTRMPIVSPPTRRPTVPFPPVTPTATTNTLTTSSQDFTIPQDILDDIFTTDYSGLINERHERK